MAMTSARLKILADLEQRIQSTQGGRRLPGRSALSLGLGELDRLLPEGGLPPGSRVELLSNTDGVGVWTLALVMGWHACGTPSPYPLPLGGGGGARDYPLPLGGGEGRVRGR